MIRLILVRHGNTFEAGQTPLQIGARTDLPLTEQGQKQAEQMGDSLLSQFISPAAIYAGALKRQIESAEIIARRLKASRLLKLREPALTEIDYGAWEGLPSDEIARRFPDEYLAWTEEGKWPKAIFGGSLQKHIDAIAKWTASLHATFAPGDVIIAVSSNGLIRFFSDAWEQFAKAKQMERLKVKTGHFCELDLSPRGPTVRSWNRSALIDKIQM